MRLNPLHPSDNPMEQVLYCFGGPDDTGGGSAADFDDTVGTKVGGGATGTYESQVDKAARERGGDNYDDKTLSDRASFERAQRATGDLDITTNRQQRQALADRAAVQGAIEAARGADRVSQLAARVPTAMTGPAPSGGDVDLTPDFLPSAMTGQRKDVYNVARDVSPVDFEGIDFNLLSDFDGGDVGDFSEFLSPEVQEKERERQEEIRKAVEEGRPIPGEIGLGNLLAPFGLGKTILEKFTERDKEFARQANLAGNQFQTNAQGQITGVYNPRENAVYTPSSVGLFDFKGQEEAAGDLYKIQRQREEEDRGSRGSDDPIIPPLIPEDSLAQDQAPEPVVGQNVITGANYQPREPVQFAYTGLPTLAPVSLQPTFQAQQQYTPTFGLGALRRS